MKKIILYIILLLAFACYKDNGEPLRNLNGVTASGSGLQFDSVPCQDILETNKLEDSRAGRLSFSTPYGYYGSGKYIYGYRIQTSATNNGYTYQYRLEFREKPTKNKIYYVSNDIGKFYNSSCFLYFTINSPTRDFLGEPGTKIYVDTAGNGLSFSYCGGEFSNSLYGQKGIIEGFNITTNN